MAGRWVRAASWVIVTAVAAAVTTAPNMASAASFFSGGPDLKGTTILNDRTTFAVHYSTGLSSGLAPNSTYKVKIRLCPGPTPSGTTNRGFTWNPFPAPPYTSTPAWVQERDTSGGTWSKCTTVTTDGRGAIPYGEGWLYAAFGDETTSGVYYLLVSLSGGQSQTYNGSVEPTVAVLNAATQASWIHNGISTGSGGGAVVTLLNEDSSTVVTVARTEPQSCDDDSNGIVDDESYGIGGATGGFRVGVPAGRVLRLKVGGAFWPSTQGFTSGPADTDIALGASDMVPPTAPGLVSATAGAGTATVSWIAPASDNTGVTAYRIYRWTAPITGAAWSPVHALVGSVAASQHSFTDETVTNGTTYYYEVRAIDAATNIGPRSVIASATPHAPVPTAQVSPAVPDGDNGWYVTTPTVTLAPSAPDRTVEFSFEPTPAAWATYGEPIVPALGASTLYFRETDGVTTSDVQRLVIQYDPVAPTTTVSAPTWSVASSTSRSFTVSWAGHDTMSGPWTYAVDYAVSASGPWTVLRPSTMGTSTVFAGASGRTYYFRVTTTDAAGNASKARVVSGGTSVPYDQTSASFSSGWRTASNGRDFLGSYRYATSSARYLNFKLSKGTLYLVANAGPKLGKIAVYFRGRRVAIVDTYSRTTKTRQVYKLVKFSGSSASTVKIMNLATRGRPRVEVDGLIVR